MGLTDTEVARRLGLSQGRYAHYVNDKREPDFQTFVNICRVLATSPDRLLGFDVPDRPAGLGEPAADDWPVAASEASILRDRIRAAGEAMTVRTLLTAATVMDALVRVQSSE